MNIMFWVILIFMLLFAIGVLVYPLLKVRKNSSLAYKDSNLKINDEKIYGRTDRDPDPRPFRRGLRRRARVLQHRP